MNGDFPHTGAEAGTRGKDGGSCHTAFAGNEESVSESTFVPEGRTGLQQGTNLAACGQREKGRRLA